jgi:SAM-dependent methyltransferase
LQELVDCAACGSQFFADQLLPPKWYEDKEYEDNRTSLKFYIEQGACIEHMVWPLLRTSQEREKSMVEIGCGFGFALDFARTILGWRVRGIDRCYASAAGATQLNLPITQTYFDGPGSLDGEKFDVALASEVIEHVRDPIGFVRNLVALLEPSGVAIFTTPNAAAIHRDQPTSDLLRILSPGFHLVFFTVDSLRRVLELGGFRYIDIAVEGDTLKAQASRTPFALRPVTSGHQDLYEAYLERRSGDRTLDIDLRIGLKYRYFKALVNGGRWDPAKAQFAELRALVGHRYRFDLAVPEKIPLPEPIPIDMPLTFEEAGVFFERFGERLPFNIVGLLYFQGALAIGTADSRKALRYFRAARKAGVIERSFSQLSMANADGETADLLRRAFLLAVLALVDVDPSESLVELARILDGEPPEDVPPALWMFTASDFAWLLGTVFTRMVDRGQAEAAERVFGRLCDCMINNYGLDVSRPESVSLFPHLPNGLSLCVDLPRICVARGVLKLTLKQETEARRYFEKAADLILVEHETSAWTSDRADLYMRTRMYAALAIVPVNQSEALATMQELLNEKPAADVPSTFWNAASDERRNFLWNAFVQLVNSGETTVCVGLIRQVEKTLGVEAGQRPDPALLATATDSALDATFCRAMLALNHEAAYRKAAEWFGSVCEAVREQLRRGTASPSATKLLWPSRYHEALSLVHADDTRGAATIQELLDEKPPADVPGAVWNEASGERSKFVCNAFVQLVNCGETTVSVSLVPHIERMLGSDGGNRPDSGLLATAPDSALDATFCRAMLALNHEAAYRKAGEWFGSVYEAVREQLRRGTASPCAMGLLWPSRYHEALSLVHADDMPAAVRIVESAALSWSDILPPLPDEIANAMRALIQNAPANNA